MSHEQHDRDHAPEQPASPSGVSRRQILTAGLAAVGAGAGAALTPSAAEAAPSDGHGAHKTIGIAAEGTTAVEFRARLSQLGTSGERFVAYGYLTRVQGTTLADLFAGNTLDVSTALLTAYAAGDLTRRVHDQSVHSVDIVGTLIVYQRPVPGASFADPASFQFGTPVAAFALTLQDVLTVFAPARGIPTLNGDMRQTLAERLDGPGRDKVFGDVNARSRLFATGLGALVNPVTLNAEFEMAGNWTTT
jgi:hypothetical protein